jgi:hypothetical protein
MVTRRQGATNKLPPCSRCPPTFKNLPEQPKKAPASRNPLVKAIPRSRALVKGILKKPPPPPLANFGKLSPSLKLEEPLVPSSLLVIVKSTPLPPPCIVLYSIEVTINKEHLFTITYTLDFKVTYVFRYT